MKLINELLQNEDRPTLLNIHSCWTHDEKSQALQFSNAQISFLPFTHIVNVSQEDLLNKLWFVVNMNCSGCWHFLRQVSSDC